jgi:hypothetical protein
MLSPDDADASAATPSALSGRRGRVAKQPFLLPWKIAIFDLPLHTAFQRSVSGRRTSKSTEFQGCWGVPTGGKGVSECPQGLQGLGGTFLLEVLVSTCGAKRERYQGVPLSAGLVPECTLEYPGGRAGQPVHRALGLDDVREEQLLQLLVRVVDAQLRKGPAL